MNKSFFISSLASALIFVSFSASSSKIVLAQDKPRLKEMVNNTVTQVIIPNIQDWNKASASFYQSSQSFCKSPDEKSLMVLQGSFNQLYTKWNRVLPFDFGPIRDNLFSPKVHFVDSFRQRGRYYNEAINRHFNQRLSDEVVLDDDYFKKLKFTLVGMPAIEILLYKQEVNNLDVFKNNPRKCLLLTGLARQNLAASDYVISGWQDDSSTGYKTLFFNNKLPEGESSATKLVFSMQDYLRFIKQRLLSRTFNPLISNMGEQNLLTGLEAIADAFTANKTMPSLQSMLKEKGEEEVSKRFIAEIELAKKNIKAKDREAINVNYDTLIKMLGAEIPQSLGVNLGMNFIDGD